MNSTQNVFFFRAARIAVASLAIMVAAASCTDRDVAETTVAPTMPATGRTVFLSLSKLNPAAGEEIVVTVNAVTATSGASVGSFKVRMSYDTDGLSYVGAVSQNDGMVIANPVNDTLIIVGASATGFASSKLASVRMKVSDPAALASLGLEIVAVTTTEFASEASVTAVDRRLFRGNVSK